MGAAYSSETLVAIHEMTSCLFYTERWFPFNKVTPWKTLKKQDEKEQTEFAWKYGPVMGSARFHKMQGISWVVE